MQRFGIVALESSLAFPTSPGGGAWTEEKAESPRPFLTMAHSGSGHAGGSGAHTAHREYFTPVLIRIITAPPIHKAQGFWKLL